MAKETDPKSQKDIADLSQETTHIPNSPRANLGKESCSDELLESSQSPRLAPDTQVQTKPPAFSTDTANPEDPGLKGRDPKSLDPESLSQKTVNQKEVDHSSSIAPKLPNALPKLAGGLAAVILLGGGIIAALNLSQRPPQSPSPVGAQIVPQDALATLTVTTDEEIWTRLRQFGTAESQTQFDQLLTNWKDRLFTLNGYRFKRDIKPWIGDRITLALLPAAEQPTGPTNRPQLEGIAAATQNIVLIAPIADPNKANALFESGPQRSAITWEDRSYKKVPIKTIQTATGQAMEAAVLGTDWLLLSNTASGIERAIDTYRGDRSLQDNDGYRSATAALEESRPLGNNFAQLYLNIPIATEVLKAPVGTSASQSGSLVPLQGSQGIVATALVESEGLRFRGTSWLLPENDLAYEDLNNEADDMLRRLPGDTLLALSGSNLQQTWQALSKGNISPPFFPDARNLQAALLTQTGLDIEADIMPWASGEFALGLLPPEAEPTKENAPDKNQAETEASQSRTDNSIAISSLALMVQTNDRATAESVWEQIDNVMVERYRYRVETTDLPEGSVTKWFSPFQGVQFSHGWLPGNVTFFTVGSDATETIIPASSSSLVGTDLFQTLTGDAPAPNNGQFFLDLAQINDTDSVFPLPQLSQELSTAKPTSAIQAIGLTSTVGDRTMDYDLYIKLSKAARPGPI
ncbi:hypothetical protein S7335_4508 [Synechococcus sp. PCC 7335]|uniref:DUF3352 domain-containing protein n=1 Tax=Synechococcus sp. (strain ATCC 29403 / PCC 7335) TaxID=91464 RepID=UPI00017EBFE7|nr:DUF3352 domain-containing protein [Synechococcus sp. PCC 7335]EDX86802.1 hypothetical protein S7335_4508 [Synechococcus sp. PCC 7335]